MTNGDEQNNVSTLSKSTGYFITDTLFGVCLFFQLLSPSFPILRIFHICFID